GVRPVLRRLERGHRAHALTDAGGVRLPVPEYDQVTVVVPCAGMDIAFRSIDCGIEALALLEPVREDEGLPRRTDLETAAAVVLLVDGVVDRGLLVPVLLLDLAGRVLAVLGHGDDLAGAGFDGDQGVAGAGGIADGHTLLDLFVRDLLDIGIETGLDRQTTPLEE